MHMLLISLKRNGNVARGILNLSFRISEVCHHTQNDEKRFADGKTKHLLLVSDMSPQIL